ncbi:MAG: 2TM domain-containing protein [Cyanobacteria bacterium Co-bin13]|nr:2TM domain-containing protein [Cyanobacteria bacterium Co-bin13]
MTGLMAERYVGDDALLYPAEDAQQILQIAIARETESGELSRSQLLEIAADLGIASETLLAAEQEWQVRKFELADQKLFDQQRRQRFQHGLSQFVIFGGFSLGLNFLIGGWLIWPIYLIFGPWALKLAWDAWRIYQHNDYTYSQEFERWRRKKQVKRAVNRFFSWLSGL